MNRSDKQQAEGVLVMACTNREGSLSDVVARHYVNLLAAEGVEASLLSLTRLAPDFMAKALYANKGKDAAFNALAAEVMRAHKMVFVVPQYNGSFPGVLKAFIDGLDVGAMDKGEVLRHKKCALVGVSRGYQGNILGLSHLGDILSYLGMHVMPTKLYLSGIPTPSREALEAHPRYLERLQAQAHDFIRL